MTVEGTDPFVKAAHALNDAGARDVFRKSVHKVFRETAKPLGASMVRGLAEDMPKRGGLSARVAASKVSVLATTTGNPKVVISLRGASMAGGQPTDLTIMNRGTVRHPIFPGKTAPRQQWRWATQSVPAGGATRAFEKDAPLVRALILRDLNRAIETVAKEGSS